jgi:glutathione S-transferase
MPEPKVVLRYFPLVGRAQPLRNALADAGIAFEDHRFSAEAWHAGRVDPELGGAYHGLPTLSWGDVTVSETLPIASFIARQSGEYDGLSSAELARREAVCSNCYLELIVRLGELIWVDLMYPGADSCKALTALAPRMLEKLAGVEAQLHEPWLCGPRPGLADHFAAEALHALRRALSPARDATLRTELPRLFHHTRRLLERPSMHAATRDRPAAFTARPDEAAVLATMQTADLAPLSI